MPTLLKSEDFARNRPVGIAASAAGGPGATAARVRATGGRFRMP
ncbi:MAG: hypothetical protein NZ585_14190 [Chloracidobacterium sp.]|nr:hypothetical protein [Chloracidobacterium sp.]